MALFDGIVWRGQKRALLYGAQVVLPRTGNPNPLHRQQNTNKTCFGIGSGRPGPSAVSGARYHEGRSVPAGQKRKQKAQRRKQCFPGPDARLELPISLPIGCDEFDWFVMNSSYWAAEEDGWRRAFVPLTHNPGTPGDPGEPRTSIRAPGVVLGRARREGNFNRLRRC